MRTRELSTMELGQPEIERCTARPGLEESYGAKNMEQGASYGAQKEDGSAPSPQALHRRRDRQDVHCTLCAISNCLWTGLDNLDKVYEDLVWTPSESGPSSPALTLKGTRGNRATPTVCRPLLSSLHSPGSRSLINERQHNHTPPDPQRRSSVSRHTT